jgi:hypothetical protein
MDLERMIQELRERLKDVNQVIVLLEQLVQLSTAESTVKRRGRKFMNNEERRQVSERMRKYWSARKKSKENDRKRQNEAA